MNPHRIICFLCVTLALSGCAGNSRGPATTSISTVQTDFIRVGDKIDIRLTGVPDDGYVIQAQVPQSGTVTVPLLSQPFRAAGRTTGDLAEEITQAYKTQRIYNTPEVSVIAEERFVSVGGDVRGPSRVIYTPDLTLLSAINSCGGFTDYARRTAVRIIRGQQVLYIDAAAAARTPGADPLLFPGDQIYVPRTIF